MQKMVHVLYIYMYNEYAQYICELNHRVPFFADYKFRVPNIREWPWPCVLINTHLKFSQSYISWITQKIAKFAKFIAREKKAPYGIFTVHCIALMLHTHCTCMNAFTDCSPPLQWTVLRVGKWMIWRSGVCLLSQGSPYDIYMYMNTVG